MSTQRPSTAIIGAGISGLTTGKALNDYGVPFTCFETSDRVGGNWAFRNPNGHSSAYQSLHIDNSKRVCSFQDHPMPTTYPDFPHHSQVKAYLDDYADAFRVREHIEFENGITRAERRAGGGWDLTDQRGQTRSFDALVVANGHHWSPRMADFPGEFTGEEIHSHYYIDPTEPLDLRDKRILVIGFGNSAVDIASELSQKSLRSHVTISTRAGGWVVPKYLFGRPIDSFISQKPMKQKGLIARAMRRAMEKYVVGDPEKWGLPKPDHSLGESHTTMSSELLVRIGSGDITPKPNVGLLDGRTVHFVDGSCDEFDVIIYATGYNISFPFFDPSFISAPDNKIRLYKRVLKPEIDDLLFVGLGQAVPSIFPFVEVQSKLVAAYLAGTYRPPAQAEMERLISADEKLYLGHFTEKPRHTQQVDFATYQHQMKSQELPAGFKRALKLGPIALEGRVRGAVQLSA